MAASEKDNAFGERIYFWVDAAGIRCGPRHRTLKAAINFYKNGQSRWVPGEDGRAALVSYDREQFPSQEKPHELRVGEYAERPLSEEEQFKLQTVQDLMRGGYV